jgi:hypothetical protein
MPMFPIESYKVSTYLERFTDETRPSRLLEMVGPVQYHGIQNRASFAFSSYFDGIWSSPVAGYLTDGGFAGLSVVGWFPVAEFSYYYDILRSERPIHVLYDFRDTGASSGYLRRVGLGTSTEPIGEGPSESTEIISGMLIQNLNSVVGRIAPMPTQKDLRKRST